MSTDVFWCGHFYTPTFFPKGSGVLKDERNILLPKLYINTDYHNYYVVDRTEGLNI